MQLNVLLKAAARTTTDQQACQEASGPCRVGCLIFPSSPLCTVWCVDSFGHMCMQRQMLIRACNFMAGNFMTSWAKGLLGMQTMSLCVQSVMAPAHPASEGTVSKDALPSVQYSNGCTRPDSFCTPGSRLTWYFAFAFSDCQKPYVLEGWYQFRRLQQQQQLNTSQHLQGAQSRIAVMLACLQAAAAGMPCRAVCTCVKLTQATKSHNWVLNIWLRCGRLTLHPGCSLPIYCCQAYSRQSHCLTRCCGISCAVAG